jgi:glutathione S-transferase
MRLYYAPGACSRAPHIALEEAGLSFTRTRVDLATHRTESGEDYMKVNPKGYVPTLVLDNGEVLTENVAILAWIADQNVAAGIPGPVGRYRLLEMLAFISSEIHKSFKPFFANGDDAAKQAARETIGKRFDYLAARLKEDFLLGGRMSVVDAYLFVMLTWAQKVGLDIPAPLQAYFQRIAGRPAVRRVIAAEEDGSQAQSKAS